MIWRRRLTNIRVAPHERLPVEIVGDGLIGTGGVGHGRMLPVLILDTRERPDIIEYVKLHQSSAPGDARFQWARFPDRPDSVCLIVSVERPMELRALIEFDLNRSQGVLVDQILDVKAACIQCGAPGDRLKDTLDRPRIVLEVPDLGYGSEWEKLYLKHLVNRLRANGMKSQEAKRVAQQVRAHMREVGDFRMPSF